MSSIGVVMGGVLACAGVAGAAAVVIHNRRASTALAYVLDDSTVPAPAIPSELDAPAVHRLFRPLAEAVTHRVRRLYPSSHLDQVHKRLLHAGMSTKLRAEEFVTVQVIAVAVAIATGLALISFGGKNEKLRIILALVLVFVAVLGPSAWLTRRVRQRTSAIERELPDVLDLLTISVEAGLGLEQAMATTCANFDSPVSEELGRTLQEMGLGLSRHRALENLKQRTASTDLSAFVLVLTQADTLGMPIGRVLRTQAEEMRNRRRARAREQAAKLPVKILFPLLLFIFPPLMILVLGPAAAAIFKVFK
ncbi:MAG: type II secretion system F family protein [Acidimicrobiales bacterium]